MYVCMHAIIAYTAQRKATPILDKILFLNLYKIQIKGNDSNNLTIANCKDDSSI